MHWSCQNAMDIHPELVWYNTPWPTGQVQVLPWYDPLPTTCWELRVEALWVSAFFSFTLGCLETFRWWCSRPRCWLAEAVGSVGGCVVGCGGFHDPSYNLTRHLWSTPSGKATHKPCSQLLLPYISSTLAATTWKSSHLHTVFIQQRRWPHKRHTRYPWHLSETQLYLVHSLQGEELRTTQVEKIFTSETVSQQ